MFLILIAVAVWFAGGALALLAGRNAKGACFLGPASMLVGGAIALVPVVQTLQDGRVLSARFEWSVPLGSFSLALDSLSAVFALAIIAVCTLAALYGGQYLRVYDQKKNLGAAWFFFNVLAASMLLVVLARNGVLFLVSWEIMSLASFFLVMFESEKEHVRRASWTYLVATHLGTAFLLAMFALLGRSESSLDFTRLHAGTELAGIVFLLAVIGFGTKAGFLCLHVWLPEAHPAAPSHVSAVMSGVMIKTGIYGLLRVLTFLEGLPQWCGQTLAVIGIASAVLGILFALAQHDLKRLLAYCSMENVGILTLGIGLGLLGVSVGNPKMAALGFAGGLLHVVNHAVFKSLLFLGAGSIIHATGTGRFDELGGLLKRMPIAGTTFLVGAVAIAGLPPLNGFISELLIYLAAFHGLVPSASGSPIISMLAIASLALAGGLATAGFAKAFGITFLGEPRSEQARHGHEPGWMMLAPMVLLALACMLIGLLGPWIAGRLGPAIAVLVPADSSEAVTAGLAESAAMLRPLGLAWAIFLAIGGSLAFARKRLLAGRSVERVVTWDCGYVAPNAHMQYTGSSFVRPIVAFFRVFLRPRERVRMPEGFFPGRADLHTDTPDVVCERVYRPLFARIGELASRFRWLQQGRLQLYVLYIALTVLVLLVWKLG